MRTRVVPALLVVAGTLLPGGGAARADTPALVQIGTGASVIRQTNANVITSAATDALTGTTHVRLSNVDWTDVDGELQPGTSFPAGVEMPIAWDFSPGGEMYVQWQDGAGNWSGPITLHVHLDASPPQVTAPEVSLRSGRQIRGGSIPLVATWTRSSTAPLAESVLERLAGAGTYTSIYRGSGRAHSLSAVTGRLYRLRVRASDVAGLQSSWAVSHALTTRLVDDRDPSIVWTRGWKRVIDPTAVGGSMRCAARSGRWADLQVPRAAELGFVSPEGRRYGTATVALSGSHSASATVKLTRPAPRPRTLAYRHAFTARPASFAQLRVTDASKNGAPVCIDAFTVLR